MDAANAKIVIQDFLRDIRSRLDEAATLSQRPSRLVPTPVT
jgi:hypothetical protein